MGRKLLPSNLFRVVGAALTLAGAIVVFVVFFLPTTASARSAHCTASEPSFIGTQFVYVSKGDHRGQLQIFVSHADAVSNVHFTAEKGSGMHWVTDFIGSANRDPGNNSVYADVPSLNPNAVGGPFDANATDGPIRINHSSDPNICYVQSSKTFHPKGGQGTP